MVEVIKTKKGLDPFYYIRGLLSYRLPLPS